MIKSKWAILLCKFSEEPGDFPMERYERQFTAAGIGTMNIVDFFSDMSHGLLDLSESEIVGPITIPIKDKKEYDSFNLLHAQDPSILESRPNLMHVCRTQAAIEGIALNKYDGLVICMNCPMDYFGHLGYMTAVADNGEGLTVSIVGQEMGHGFGLDHSRQHGSDTDYKDPWDAMSTNDAYIFFHPEYFRAGPGLNAANMASRGWLDESRVWYPDDAEVDTSIQLRPLHQRNHPGFLAASLFDEYFVEYRKMELWDAGIPHSSVLIHRFADNHSYIMPGTKGNYDLVAGDEFKIKTGNLLRRVKVESIDDAASTATIRLVAKGKVIDTEPELVSPIDWFKVIEGAISVNGQVCPIPKWSPTFGLLKDIINFQTAGEISDAAIRREAQRLVLGKLSRRISLLESRLDPFRTPMKKERGVV